MFNGVEVLDVSSFLHVKHLYDFFEKSISIIDKFLLIMGGKAALVILLCLLSSKKNDQQRTSVR